MNKSNLGPGLVLAALVIGFLALEFPQVAAYGLIALAWAVGLSAALMVAYVIFWQMRNWFSPTVRVRASVVRKCAKPWDVSIPGETPEMAAARLGTLGRDPESAAKAYLKSAASSDAPEIEIMGGVDYYVTFDVNGRETELRVSETAYIQAQEGDEGLLVFRGERFMQFTPRV